MAITVTVLDTGGIQPFIFGSNVLRENIGASELVHRATRLWAFEVLADLEKDRHNIDVAAAKEDRIRDMYTGQFVADGSEQAGAEVLYAGGGNTVILFQGHEHLERAQKFVYHLSRRVLQEAPGLNLYAAHESYTWGGAAQSLPAVVDKALKELGKLKGKAIQSRPALGFPVTAACTSTGLPANGRHPDNKGKTGSASRANRQVEAKWVMALNAQTNDDARIRLRGLAPDAVGRGKEFDWADEFDELADLPDRDDSYIAVVHADGNGMGRRIIGLTAHWKKPENAAKARGYIDEMRELSIRMQETAQDAMKNTLKALLDHLTDHDSLGPTRHSVKEDHQKFQKIFPVRPIVFGGDDVTLVCAGPWGLAVAQRYLAELERQSLTGSDEDRPYACAGVSIVKTHYPFSQAYDLSESLLKSAKEYTKQMAEKQASALDWHFTTTGLSGSLTEIRNREYVVAAGLLHMRPIALKADYGWRNWDVLTRLIDEFGEFGDWQIRRNKTIRLREALRGGPKQVAEFWNIFREKGKTLPTVPLDSQLTLKDGWIGDPTGELRCLYFDPIEVAEQFFELPGREGI